MLLAAHKLEPRRRIIHFLSLLILLLLSLLILFHPFFFPRVCVESLNSTSEGFFRKGGGKERGSLKLFFPGIAELGGQKKRKEKKFSFSARERALPEADGVLADVAPVLVVPRLGFDAAQ